MPELYVSGQICGASGFGARDVFCKWRFECGVASTGVIDLNADSKSGDDKTGAGSGGAGGKGKGSAAADSKWQVLPHKNDLDQVVTNQSGQTHNVRRWKV